MKEEKVVIITGSSSGIGKTTALYLAERNYKVYGISRSKTESDNIFSYQADINDTAKIEEIIHEIFQKEKRIDALINNAGFGIAGAIEDTKEENIKALIATNLTATIVLCSKIIPFLKKVNGGKIINISSVGGVFPLPYQACYSATKAGVEIFSRALDIELRLDKIKVVAVLPGDTKTGFTKSRIIDKCHDQEKNRSMLKSIEKMASDEQNGTAPQKVSKVIYKILEKKNPPTRVSVGFVSKFELFLSKFLPIRFVNFIISKIYG